MSVQDLDNLYRKAKSSRSRLEPTWWMNLSYYQGNGGQWVAWDGRGLYKPKLSRNRITIEDNRIQPCVRTEVAKMTKNRPVFTVTPRTADEEDANASELAEQLMKYLWEHLSLQEMTVKGLLWSRICGAGFLKAFWDPTQGTGRDAVVGPGNQILKDASGAPVDPKQFDPQGFAADLGLPPGSIQTKRINQGDIRVEVRSPFQMFIDPLVDSFTEAEWVIEESIKSVESVQQRYNVTVKPDAQANPGLVEAALGGMMNTGGGVAKGVRVREYWCKPGITYPNGHRIVWTASGGDGKGKQTGQILLEEDNPFDPMPYVMLSGIPVPGRMWPTSIVEQLRGPQTELNKVLSQIAENCNRVGNPTILASKQAVQDPEKFVSSMTLPGGTYFFDDLGSPNAVPTYLQAPQLPAYVTDRVAQIIESIQDISGQHEVTSANVPPGVTAASAINLLQEADNTRLGPAITDYEVQLGRFGQKVMKLAARFYTDQRTVRIAGDDGGWEIFDFRGAMLRDNTHVQVQAGSAFPQSKAAKQAAMQDLLTFFVQSGNPPHGKQLAEFLKDWEVGGVDRLIEEYTLDEQQVKRQIAQMYQGMQVQANPDVDNSQAIVDGLRDEMKTRRFEQQSPQIKALFTALLQQHQQIVASQQQAQMQLQMQMQGQPPPGQADAQGAQDMQGGAQQQALQAAQGQQQMDLQGAQGASQQQTAEQQRQHAEELHQQKMHHAEELHRQRLHQGGQSGR